MAWKKGQSGNPGGRAHDPFRKMIRERSKDGKALVDVAFKLLKSEDEDIQIKALGWLSDRGWGKPVQDLGFEAKEGQAVAVTIINYGDH